MRGSDQRSGSLFSYVDLERRVPKDHPLRAIRTIVDVALSALSGAFAAMYAPLGRPSIAPEKLLRALLLQAFYTVRSERQLMERLEFDLLFRWFARRARYRRRSGLGPFCVLEEPGAAFGGGDCCPVPHVHSRSGRDPEASVRRALLGRWNTGGGLGEPEELRSPRGARMATSLRHHRDATKRSTSAARSGATRPTLRPPIRTLGSIARDQAWKPSSASSVTPLMENRNGLFVAAARLTNVSGHAERLAALDMIEPYADRATPITLGGDKGFDAR